ncbi:hypothetical protein [Leptospira wolffii]|uniref:hypothetical protein n=1 Tax=Leptospira wolffii TaxID=409998 RepID=UPI0002FEBE62|nr:hypothetical protein [Leptospira wolffii]EPG66417.1 hypothetical protein LEP1GSC061_4231 [Leptospira wolffii serovar Khorat str. Khorat-H2]
MKNTFYLILAYSLVCCSSISKTNDVNSPPSDNYGPRLETILNRLIGLVNHSKVDNNLIQKLLYNGATRINSDSLRIQVDPSLPKSIYGGAEFAFDNLGDNPRISVSPYLIDLFEKRPSIVFSILIHEFQHSDSFFSNKKGFVQTRKNPIEKYLYELDAFHVEAVFIRDYMEGNRDFQLSEFEKFLSNSFSKDNLGMFSYGFYKFDMNLIFSLNDMTHSNKAKEVKYEELARVTDEILNDDYEKYNEDWVQFNQVVPLYTIATLYTQFVRDIETYPMTDRDIARMSNFNLKRDNPKAYTKLEEINRKLKKYGNRLDFIIKIQEKYSVVE